MPSQMTAKTVEKKIEKKEELVKVIANRTFAVEYSKEEIKQMRLEDKEKRSFVGATRNIMPGEKAEISKEIAKKLQKAGVIQIEL